MSKAQLVGKFHFKKKNTFYHTITVPGLPRNDERKEELHMLVVRGSRGTPFENHVLQESFQGNVSASRALRNAPPEQAEESFVQIAIS